VKRFEKTCLTLWPGTDFKGKNLDTWIQMCVPRDVMMNQTIYLDCIAAFSPRSATKSKLTIHATLVR
jgi:hypothetical protein